MSTSKTYCPFCVTVKKLLSELGATFKAVELDTESNLLSISLSFFRSFFFSARDINLLTGNELFFG